MKIVACIATVALTGVVMADYNPGTLVQWDFNGPSTTSVPGGSGSPTPSVGFGTASLFGGTTGSFASGTVDGGSSDPVNTSPPNYGWNITTFAAQNEGNLTRGVQFLVSTEGWDKIVVSWDQRNSNTASRYLQFLYTLDGTTYSSDGLANGGIIDINAGNTWFNGIAVDLSDIAGAANNANFGFRLLATFAPQGGYQASNPGSNYGPAGTWRFDMVTVNGNFIPAPGAVALLGIAGLVARRRR
ncbi:MAG: hypothetical protein KF724_02920 [Phycisphaeraceae bacterium]|nr:hypothetical protein [Phycisphaeraceae bacterium]